MKKMLEYQKIDGELFKLEKLLHANSSVNIMKDSKNVANQAKDKLANMERIAENYFKTYTELQKAIESNLRHVEVLNKQNLNSMDAKTLHIFQEKTNLVNKNLGILERKLYSIQDNIQKHLSEFNRTMKMEQNAKSQHFKAKEKFDEQSEKIKPEINELKKKLETLQSNLPANLFEKYQKVRKDNIYPVFVPLVDKRCGACRMELPSAILDTLKRNKMIECEQCRRIIYDNEE